LKRGSNQRHDEQRCLEYEAGGTAHRCRRARARVCTPPSRDHGNTTAAISEARDSKTKTDEQEPSAQKRMSLHVPGASGAPVSAHGSWGQRWCRCRRVLLGRPCARLYVSAQEQRTNRATNRGRRLQKSDENWIKSTRTAPKICTHQIQCATNLAPRNHCLGLTQTPEKRDRRHEQK
jgi:hypothetical protein